MSSVGSLAELSIHPHTGDVRRASDWLACAGNELGVPADQIHRLDLCLNEALANIITHGGATALAFPIRLLFDVCHGQNTSEATVTVSDAGAAFDPVAAPLKPQAGTLAEAEPGGLGLLMIRSFVDQLNYRYNDGRNHLIFSVRWATAPHE
jgi:anti-sigma regulatory factor (Ser/Thr protein kinase)